MKFKKFIMNNGFDLLVFLLISLIVDWSLSLPQENQSYAFLGSMFFLYISTKGITKFYYERLKNGN
jgi:hypothetical protein|tara:strand:+ start:608 stop:805 length:198 start_codon:yes stop_codon:yes gene_type:complete